MEPSALPTAQEKEDSSVIAAELFLSNLLRVGVLTSLFLIAVGTGLSFFHHPEYVNDPHVLQDILTASSTPHRLADVLTGIQEVRGQAVVMIGLLLLIAVPVLRVALSVVLFARQRDRTYVVITSIVLLLLLVSFALGRATE